jgi:hypothetical protein
MFCSTYDSNQMVDLLHFAFGCSYEEHLRYGRCVDGKCGRRAKFEQTILATNDGLRARGANDDDTLAAVHLITGCPKPLSAIHVAVYRCDRHAIRKMAFIKEGVNSKERGTGFTPLHIAVIICRIDAVLRLLETFEDVIEIDCVDNNGDTPLHIACREGFNDVVAVLCDAGARPDACLNKAGLSCLQVARTHQITQILKLAMDEQSLERDITAVKNKRAKIRAIFEPSFLQPT